MSLLVPLAISLIYLWIFSNCLILVNAYLCEEFPEISDPVRILLTVGSSLIWPLTFPLVIILLCFDVLRKDSV